MPRTFSGKLVPKVELSEVMGVAAPTISHWIKRGCPYVEEGSKSKQWVFNTADVIDWRMDRLRSQYEDPEREANVIDYNEARRKRMAAEAELAELQLARERSQVVSIDVVELQWTNLLGAAKSQILAVPHKMAHRFVAMRNAKRIENLMRAELNQALTDLSMYEPDDLPSDDTG
jgi:phage terminase Nu1 subunit (DNA packaging protein)